MRRLILNMTAALLLAAPAAAQETAPQLERVGRQTSFAASLRREVYANPASRQLQRTESFTQLNLTGTLMDATASRLAQLGSGNDYFGFEASTFTLLGENSAVWGEAGYSNGRRDDVVWNETSDFELLYPYVLADETGGRMDYEEYLLDGGYGARHGRVAYGVQLRYRARSEYRSVDPRPRNIVADLVGRAGVGLTVGKSLLSASALAGKYKQTNELQFYNELGAQKEYHLTGLGNDFARFSGANNNVFYKGVTLGGSVELTPLDGRGWSAVAEFERFSFEKILTDLNRLPLNKMVVRTAKAEVAWLSAGGGFGAKAEAEYSSRRGNDNRFGDAASNIYPQIGTERVYESDRLEARLSGVLTLPVSGRLALSAMPEAWLSSFRSSHSLSGNSLDADRIGAGVKLRAAYARPRGLLQATVGADFAKGLSVDANFASTVAESLHAVLLRAADYLDKSVTGLSARLRYDHALRRSSLTVFGEAGWTRGMFLSGESDNRYEIKIGITL